MMRPEMLRALVAITLVVGTAASAVMVSTHPGGMTPTSTLPPGAPPDYLGNRISLTSAADIAPPPGCQALNYPPTEAALRLAVGEIPENYYWGYWFDGGVRDGGAMPPTAASTQGGLAEFGAATPDYSGTNNQVAGVDEADTVKTDGWFIYTASGGKVVTTRAYPASQLAVVSTIEVNGYTQGIFVVGDRMAVIFQPSTYYAYPTFGGGVSADMSFAPVMYQPEVEVRVFDITDRANPALLSNFSVSGNFAGARMVGDFVYLVTDYNIYRVGDDLRLPVLYKHGFGAEIAASSIGLPNGVHNTTFLTTVLTLNLTAPSDIQAFSFLTKGGGQLFASARNLYILGTNYEYDSSYNLLRTETTISKLSFYKGEVKCYFGATVPGTILNQFSADEAMCSDKPFLRLATTTRTGSWGNASAAVYVLDETLHLAGSVEGIAPGELSSPVGNCR